MQTLIYGLAIIIIFFVPASLILKNLLKVNVTWSVTFGIGIGLWVIVSYLLHLTGLAIFLRVYIFICVVLFIKLTFTKFSFPKIQFNWLLLLLVGCGVFIQSMFVVTSGIQTKNGLQFSYINSYDGIFYAALSQSLTHTFPAFEPGLANVVLRNYHFLSFLVVADMHQLFGLDIFNLHFSLIPVTMSILLGFIAYDLGFGFTDTKRGGYLFTFFMYFASDLGYLTTQLLLHQASVTGLQSVDSNFLLLTNFPRAMALVVMVSGWTVLWKYRTQLTNSLVAILGLLGAALIGIKIYYGIFFLMLLVAFAYKKWKGILPGILGSAAVFLPGNSNTGGLAFVPGAWPAHFFASTRLQETLWPLKEQVYIAHKNWLHQGVLYLQYTSVYLFTELGPRIIGGLQFKHFRIWALSVLFVSISILFLQRTGIFDIFNFLSVGAVGLSLLLADWLKNKRIWIIVVVLILIMPRALWQTQQALNNSSYQYISSSEMQALKYLRDHSPQGALIFAWPENDRNYSPYIQLFSDRQVYLSNRNILNSHNANIGDRQTIVDTLVRLDDFNQVNKNLTSLDISYVYVKRSADSWNKYQLPKNSYWFVNSDVAIYKIK